MSNPDTPALSPPITTLSFFLSMNPTIQVILLVGFDLPRIAAFNIHVFHFAVVQLAAAGTPLVVPPCSTFPFGTPESLFYSRGTCGTLPFLWDLYASYSRFTHGLICVAVDFLFFPLR
jgi:hypothetical protein